MRKKRYLCAAVPVISLPDYVLVMNPGFPFYITFLMNEIDLLTKGVTGTGSVDSLTYLARESRHTAAWFPYIFMQNYKNMGIKVRKLVFSCIIKIKFVLLNIN